MSWEIITGDCIEEMRKLEESSVDAVVTDPPYGLSREPDIAEVLQHWLAGDDYEHRGGGFMGQSWDSFVPGPAYWRECYRCLKPGGHLLSFAGSRTADLMGISIRLAGFEIRDSIMWLYGSGFPKSLDVSKAIDKRAEDNVETKRRIELVAEVIRSAREAKNWKPQQVSEAVVGTPSGACWNWEHKQLPSIEKWAGIKSALGISDDFDGLIEGDRSQFIGAERAVVGQRKTGIGAGQGAVAVIGDSENRDITAPATPEAAQWEGWGTALKPAHEPIVVARKPLIGSVAENVLEHGTGGLNIDACRIEGGQKAGGSGSPPLQFGGANSRPFHETAEPTGANFDTSQRRWPANVILPHTEDCVPVGVKVVKGDQRETGNGRRSGGFADVGADSGDSEPNAPVYGHETVEAWECAPGCPIAELDAQSGERASGKLEPHHRRSGPRLGVNAFGDDQGDPSSASAGRSFGDDSGGASRFFYCAKTSRAEREAGLGRESGPRRNDHPTVKPINLMRWLVRLVAPSGGTVLDPFLGSGSTGCAAVLEGFDFIGIEREPEYVAIAENRIAYWAQHEGREVEDVLRLHSKSTKAAKEREESGQGSLLAPATSESEGAG